MIPLTDLRNYEQALLVRINNTLRFMNLAPGNAQPLSQALLRKDAVMLERVRQEIQQRVSDTNNQRNITV
jgi:hypothetical protein